MNLTKFIAFAAIAAMLPSVAFAQTAADLAYCKAMGAKYRVVNRGADPAANIAVAIYKCETKPAEAIPVLEKELMDDKMRSPLAELLARRDEHMPRRTMMVATVLAISTSVSFAQQHPHTRSVSRRANAIRVPAWRSMRPCRGNTRLRLSAIPRW